MWLPYFCCTLAKLTRLTCSCIVLFRLLKPCIVGRQWAVTPNNVQ